MHTSNPDTAPLDAVALLPEDAAVFPVSFAQERLWFLEQLDPGLGRYNTGRMARLEGALDVAALERAVEEVGRRHETLRTVFRELDGAPVQVIFPEPAWRLERVDLSGWTGEARAEELRRRGRAPFDLEAGPLVRAELVRVGPDEHVLVLLMHHIVSDGWSMGVLFHELSELYAAFVRGEEPRLPELPIQYADYAVWQREYLSGETLEAELAWWRERLRGAPAVLELPTDRPRPAVRSHRGALHVSVVRPEVLDALRALARREGATLFMVLLAAFDVLLARYAGQEDVVVGTPVAGRTRTELEGLIGFFINTLALRTDLSGDPTFREVLGRVRAATLGAFQHQELPFERLVEELQPERSLSHTPVFQVLLTLQNAPTGELELPEVRWRMLEMESGTAKFDLSLFAVEDAGGLSLAWEYATDLFDAETIERMAGHLGVLLEGIAREPERRVAELPLLGAAERRRVLEEWSAGGGSGPREGCVHELVAAQAARTPDAVALRFGEERITYRDLDACANRLAHALRKRGVGPEVPVGVCLERTPALVVALLGVLRAGGCYVPLDPSHPAERLAYMVEDAGARFVLTETALTGRLPAGVDPVALDRIADELSTLPDAAPEVRVLPENLSHVIFTSGSTGRPKGVMIRHRGVAVLMHWLRGNVTDEERSGVLFSTSVSFDVSVAEIFGTLCWGGTLFLVENALELPKVADRGIVYASMVPTAAAELLRSGGIPASVRTLNLGGEPLPADLARALYATGTVEKVGNLYGPTEDTTYSTYSLVERGGAQVLIGRPVANTRAYVLDGELAPAPVGVVGELYLAGDGLARGYARRPDLTAERFLPDPFGEPGSRMYRVMDRVRWRRDGELEYFGRTDFQVKVRGFRIELGEIEAVLRAHPSVRDAVVVVREDAPGDRRLAAYVAAPGEPPAPAGLRAWLRERLPEYMVPSVFVPLETLPRNASGKVDRAALPVPGAVRTEAYVPPRTATERTVAEVWQGVLRVERVGAHDDFFDLGGHSLLATQAASRLRQALAVEVPLRALFEHPTVAALALHLEELERSRPGAAPAEFRPRPRDGAPLRLSFAQERLWFLDRLEPGSALYRIASTLHLEGTPDVAALERTLGEIVRRHESLRTVFAGGEGEPVQLVRPAGEFRLEVEELTGAGAEEVRRRAHAEAQRPFDLERGPLFRATLLRAAPDAHVLVLAMHHIVSDGWSMGVLFRELSELYAAFARGEPSPLPELPVQYADYAVWQREYLSGETLETELSWWRERLRGAPAVLELPTDRPRPPVQSHRGALHSFEVEGEALEGLRALARQEGATLFMVLLAVLDVLLAKYTAQEDVVVGTPIAGRTRTELEGVIGFFVNTLALRTDLSGDPTFREVLGRVREATLGAYAHQELPFEKLVEELQPERSLSHAPVFQVLFTLQNVPDEGVRLPGLALRPAARGEETAAKFDLSLFVVEHPDGLGAAWEYATDLFDRETVERMGGHLRVLLREVARDPDRRLSGLGVLTPGERERVLVEWNPGVRSRPADRTLTELFQAQAARTPGGVAVTCEGERLTYAELNARANQLAHHLRAKGVGPETRVGVCLERSLELVVALLATLKAGGAYVPLDPAYPAERLAFLLEDAGVPVLLTQARHLDALPPSRAEVVCMDADREEVSRRSTDDPAGGALPDPEGLAYVIYTSGSTGKPKGVGVSHRNVARLFAATEPWFGFGPDDVWTLFHSFAFDFSVWELWGALLYGGRVVVVPFRVSRSPEAFHELLRRERVTVLNQTPSAFYSLVDADADAPGGLALRCVVFGGEALDFGRLRPWILRHGAERPELVNMYGITELTVHVTRYLLRAEDADGAAGSVIGRPIPDLRTYVLDAGMQPVPVGVPGELYVGGAGLARGYLNRPGLTAERFGPDPFAGEPGARLYRTGDRVRWLPDGTLEYLGRVDHQVKVRGYRIEPGEIESVLRQHPGVREALVVVREERGDRRLVAYVVGEEDAGAALRSWLRERLPEHMVPSAVVAMDAFPLTSNGKVDRAALPAPDGRAGPEDGYAAPRNLAEETVAGIWAEVLGRERVGIHDDFFDLGGHSLSAVRLMSKLEKAFNRSCPLALLFQGATVASLAERLYETGVSGAGPRHAVPLQPRGERRPFFCVHPQFGEILCYVPLARHLGSDRPLYGIRSAGLDGDEEPLGSFEEMAARYVEAVRTVQPEGPYLIGGHSVGGLIAYEMAQQLRARGDEVASVVLMDTRGVVPEDYIDHGATLLRVLSGPAHEAFAERLRGMHPLEQLDYAREYADSHPDLPPWTRTFVRVFRAHDLARLAYVPEPYDGHLTLLYAQDEPREPHWGGLLDPLRYWSSRARGGFEVHDVPGTHGTMVNEPHAGRLAAVLAACLDRLDPAKPSPAGG